MYARCFENGVSAVLETLGIHLQPQTSQEASKLASFHSRKRLHVLARACARAREHVRMIFIPNVRILRTRSGLGLISPSPSLPCRILPLDSLLICAAVTNMLSPLRGDSMFARQRRIVTLQKLNESYQIRSALNCARGAQQCRASTARTAVSLLILNHKS